MTVTLTLTTDADRHIVTNMFTAYFFDMTQYDDDLMINEHGLPVWAPFGGVGPRDHVECVRYNWWIRDHCQLLVTRVDGKPAGFVIILADKNHLTAGIDFELMDFYVAPKYRRQGVGRLAARLAFERHHGQWQVFQLVRNLPARAFWQKVVAEYTGGQYENLDDGVQQRFRN